MVSDALHVVTAQLPAGLLRELRSLLGPGSIEICDWWRAGQRLISALLLVPQLRFCWVADGPWGMDHFRLTVPPMWIGVYAVMINSSGSIVLPIAVRLCKRSVKTSSCSIRELFSLMSRRDRRPSSENLRCVLLESWIRCSSSQRLLRSWGNRLELATDSKQSSRWFDGLLHPFHPLHQLSFAFSCIRRW